MLELAVKLIIGGSNMSDYVLETKNLTKKYNSFGFDCHMQFVF